MKKKNAEALGAVVGIGAIIVVSGVIDTVKTVRIERAKRKKIKQWETNALNAIRSSSERLRRVAEDPNTTLKDLVVAWREEEAFCKLIREQPMY